MPLIKFGNHGQNAENRMLVRAYRNLARVQVVKFSNGIMGAVTQIKDLARVIHEHFSFRSKRAILRRAVKHFLPDFLLQSAYGLADRRLCPLKRCGGTRKALFPRHGNQYFQLIYVHRLLIGPCTPVKPAVFARRTAKSGVAAKGRLFNGAVLFCFVQCLKFLFILF
jgi:hypothetical protein